MKLIKSKLLLVTTLLGGFLASCANTPTNSTTNPIDDKEKEKQTDPNNELIDNPSLPGSVTGDTQSIQLSLKSKEVVASDVIVNANNKNNLNWEKFNTNLTSEQQKTAIINNIDIDDEKGMISFDLGVNDKKITFKQAVEYNFKNIASYNVSWLNVKDSTTDDSIDELKKVVSDKDLSKFADPALISVDKKNHNRFTYLSGWFDISLKYTTHKEEPDLFTVRYDSELINKNSNKKEFFKITDNNKEKQIWTSNTSKRNIFVEFVSDIKKAVDDVIINQESDLLQKPVSYYVDDKMQPKEDVLLTAVKPKGLLKFQNPRFDNYMDISLSNKASKFNFDTNQLTFRVDIYKPQKDDGQFFRQFKEFTITLKPDQKKSN
ncbi:hypothetical protein [Mycoplasma sp. E35C]|uniref:hypothetical protein n=1 Tax=Mycoplasma sp. E35C TaxID=2801918 RepID=UPI001CA434DF|nr:hypothetical protein [Mycoplasma sp. E35C]QZX49269.1 hypothetical protein JJE79_00680 [Mycoplasma sp. E35C]